MSQLKSHLKIIASLGIAALFALNCSRGASQTQFSKNLEADKDKPALTYEEWVSLVGQEKTDALYAGIGQDSLNLLSNGYGIGQSNMVQLINTVTEANRLTTLIGNDNIVGLGTSSKTGLGVPVIVYLMKSVDAQMTTAISSNLDNGFHGGGAAPTDKDTILNVANLVNGLASIAQVQTHLVEFIGVNGLNIPRNVGAGSVVIDRLAKLVAHVGFNTINCTTICTLLGGLTATEMTTKLAPMLNGVTSADKLVEVVAKVTTTANLITVIQGINPASNVTAKLVPIMNTVSDGTKLGYVINTVTTLTNLTNLINNVTTPVRMGTLINSMEDGTTWTGQVGGAQTWGGPAAANKSYPFNCIDDACSTAGKVIATTITGNGVGTCTSTPSVTFSGGGGAGAAASAVVNNGNLVEVKITNAGSGYTSAPTIAFGAGCTTTPVANSTVGGDSGMPRLVSIINNLTAGTWYKLLHILDTVSDMTKMSHLVQDVVVINDLTYVLNNLGGLVGGGACTTAVAFAGGTGAGAAATAFITGGQISHITVTAGGSYTVAPTATVTGCTGGTYTAVPYIETLPAAGPIISISVMTPGVYPQTNANAISSMAALMEAIPAAQTAQDVPRLRELIDGERVNANAGGQRPTAGPSYLNNLIVLLQNLDQSTQGPQKVYQLIDTVTVPDKMIDLVNDVTVTTNLAGIINGINSAQSASPNDTAVYTMANVLQNIVNTYKLVDLINTVNYVKIKDLINQVASGSHAPTSDAYNKLVPIIDNTNNVTPQLSFTMNYVSAITQMSTLINALSVASAPKIATLINAISGTNCWQVTNGIVNIPLASGGTGYLLPPTVTISDSTLPVPGSGAAATASVSGGVVQSVRIHLTGSGYVNPANISVTFTAVNGGSGASVTAGTVVTGSCATTRGLNQAGANAVYNIGMGKLVNTIDYSTSIGQLATLINGVTNIDKLGYMINRTRYSSNLVGVMNSVMGGTNNATMTDLTNLLENMSLEDVNKMVYIIAGTANAAETGVTTPSVDHDLIVQLLAPVGANSPPSAALAAPDTVTATSGVGYSALNQMIGKLRFGAAGTGIYTAGALYTVAPTAVNFAGGGATTQGTAVAKPAIGQVTEVVMTTEGAGCTSTPSVTFTPVGAGSGAAATAITVPDSVNAGKLKVKAVVVTNGGGAANPPGTNYTAAPTVNFSAAGCTTAPAATATVGAMTFVDVTAGGSGYTSNPTVSFTGGTAGTAASSLTATVSGALATITIAGSVGVNYVTGQTCNVTGAGGTGATCTITETSGYVTACAVVAAGSGYSVGRKVKIEGGCAAGSGATGTVATVTGGILTSVNMSEPADYLATVLTLVDKTPAASAINYNGAAPNISAREGMIRMILGPIRYNDLLNGFNAPNNAYHVFPGIGPVHLADRLMSNLGATGVETILGVLNSDTTSLSDIVTLVNCLDHVEYGTSTTLDNHFMCSDRTFSLW